MGVHRRITHKMLNIRLRHVNDPENPLLKIGTSRNFRECKLKYTGALRFGSPKRRNFDSDIDEKNDLETSSKK